MGFDWFKGFGPVPVPGVVNYLPTWHNRLVRSNSGNWTSCRNGAALALFGNYQRPLNQLIVDTYLTASYFITRSWLNFDTQGIGTIKAARLGIYPTAKGGIPQSIYITKGLSLEPIDQDDWAAQTNEITSLGSIALADIVLNQYNWITLNAAGIAWINQSALEKNQIESYDWQNTAYFLIYGAGWVSQSRVITKPNTITSVKLKLWRTGSPGTMNVRIYNANANHMPTGSILASGSINANTFTQLTTGDWYEITLGAGFPPTVDNEYCTVIYAAGGSSGNRVNWLASSAYQYPSGMAGRSTNSGGSWTPQTAYDCFFIDYETALVGGTNFCLRTAHDRGDSAPGAGADYNLRFYSAQKGEGYLPLLEVTS